MLGLVDGEVKCLGGGATVVVEVIDMGAGGLAPLFVPQHAVADGLGLFAVDGLVESEVQGVFRRAACGGGIFGTCVVVGAYGGVLGASAVAVGAAGEPCVGVAVGYAVGGAAAGSEGEDECIALFVAALHSIGWAVIGVGAGCGIGSTCTMTVVTAGSPREVVASIHLKLLTAAGSIVDSEVQCIAALAGTVGVVGTNVGAADAVGVACAVAFGTAGRPSVAIVGGLAVACAGIAADDRGRLDRW